MGVEVLLHAFDHSKALKGTPQDMRTDRELMTHPWGRKETLPLFVVLNITDGVLSELKPFLHPWLNDVQFSVLNDTIVKRRYGMSVAHRTVIDFGQDRGISARMIDHLISEYGATLVSLQPDRSSAVIDVPKTDFDAVELDILDRFEEVLDSRRFRFDASVVDSAIAAGGRLSTTFAAVEPSIIDRRA